MPKDDLDNMLQGKDQDISSDSQSGTEDAGSNSDNPNEDAGGQPEEVEFRKLSGDAQDRFRKIYRERQDAQKENQRLRSMLTQVPPSPQGQQGDQGNVKEALRKLDESGVATKEFVQAQVQEILARKTFYDDLDKLEQNLDGSDGRPKFVREEYEDYVGRHPQYSGYLPKDVYNIMYEEELTDWKYQHRTNNNNSGKSTQTLKPTRTSVRESDLTMEQIEEKLASLPEPQRSEWYSANQKKINDVLSRSA